MSTHRVVFGNNCIVHLIDSDEELRDLLMSSRTIAIVGLSNRHERDSYMIGHYLLKRGYQIIPVNPNIDSAFGIAAVHSLRGIPHPVDIVDVFRRSQFVPDIIDSAIERGDGAVWLQIGVIHEKAAGVASNAGLPVVMDRCIMVEHRRLITGR